MNNLLKYIDERLADPTTQGSVGLLMVRKYVEDNMEDHHIQNLKAYAHDFDCTIEEAEKALRIREEAQPERKKGKWIYDGKQGRFPACKCSVCGHYENADWTISGSVNYCPNCGADMKWNN